MEIRSCPSGRRSLLHRLYAADHVSALPEQDLLAQEVADDLQVALEQFQAIVDRVGERDWIQLLGHEHECSNMTRSYLPPELWINETLKLPKCLSEVYRIELNDLGRFEDACQKPPSGDIGGSDAKSTQDHFTWRFAASAARNGYLALDPKLEFSVVSKDLLEGFASGRISVLDVPCGTGAGLLGLLSMLSDLRRLDAIGRLPLEVSITAGDFSPSARSIYENMLNGCKADFDEQGIRIDFETLDWDASDEPTTARLVDRWFQRSTNIEEYIVLISAFSGDGASKFEEFDRSFQHIASRMHDRLGTMLWVEPCMKKSGKFLNSVSMAFQKLKSWFGFDKVQESEFIWQHPFSDYIAKGRLMVMRHKRIEVSDGS